MLQGASLSIRVASTCLLNVLKKSFKKLTHFLYFCVTIGTTFFYLRVPNDSAILLVGNILFLKDLRNQNSLFYINQDVR